MRDTLPGSIYSMHPGFAMEAAYAVNLVKRTGKNLEEWVELVKATGPASEKERREWLKSEHGMTTNYAWWIAETAEGKDASSAGYEPEKYVDEMFAGGKAGLRPVYDALLDMGFELGEDVKACPCQTIVPLYRKHVFAQIKPTTRTRIDFGFALWDLPGTERLIETGGFAKKDRITHRIPISAVEEIDDEVRHWLRTAYEMDR
jgi:hypothetical protein